MQPTRRKPWRPLSKWCCKQTFWDTTGGLTKVRPFVFDCQFVVVSQDPQKHKMFADPFPHHERRWGNLQGLDSLRAPSAALLPAFQPSL